MSNNWDAGKKEPLAKNWDISSTPLNPVRQQDYPQPLGVDKILQSLFSSNPEEDSQPSITRYSRIPKPKSPQILAGKDCTVDDSEVLRRMLYKEKRPIKDSWEQCKKAIRSGAWKSLGKRFDSQRDNFVKQDVFGDLLLEICRFQSKYPLSRSTPAASEVIRLYSKYRVLKYHWDDIFWIQIRAVMECIYQSRSLFALPNAPVSKFSHKAILLFEELLNIWEIFMEQYGMQQQALEIDVTETGEIHFSDTTETTTLKPSISRHKPRTWRGLPDYEETMSGSGPCQADPLRRFLQFLPRYPNRPVDNIVGAAIMTFDCSHTLVKGFPASKSVIENARPLLSFIENFNDFNHTSSFKRVTVKYLMKQGASSEIVKVLMTGWESSSRTAKKRVTLINAPVDPSSKNVTDHDPTGESSQVMSLIDDLGRATERSDTGLAISLWHKFHTKPMLKEVKKPVREQIFALFLSAFFSLRRPELAVRVWNFIITSGDLPQRKHWQAMIVGTGKAKDVTSMQQIWSDMQAAGIEPDTQSWTAWIHGLIKCGEWQAGIGALKELALLWKKAQSTKSSEGGEIGQLLPAIEPVNGAISGLLAIGRTETVSMIFRWAKLQNLPISTSTFNIMLRPAVRRDDAQEVDRLLSEMELHNCQPDIVTLTIILNGFVGNTSSSFHAQTLESQHAIIQNLLTSLQNRGLHANTRTYSTLLDGLLAPQSLNLTAARAVLDHMAKNQLKPSAHIYTILVVHYFAANPPDLPAVDSLWRRIRMEKGVLDSVFYDRMIEGYARTGQIEKMLFFVRQVSREGKSPSWMALLAVLQELARVHEWDFAAEFVTDVLDRKSGVLRYGEGSVAGREWFWDLVYDLRHAGCLKMDADSTEALLPCEMAA